MKMFNLKQFFGLIIFAFWVAGHACAQVNLPKQRDNVIEAAEAFLKSLELPVPEDKNALDPFLGNIRRDEPQVDEPAKVDVAPSEIDSVDLLRRLAQSINASGTAIMGDNRFLLTSRQRLAVGSVFVVKLNGRDYEVMLSEVTSTTFTIKRNNQAYTRAVKL